MADYYDCALAYARRGWPVLPLRPGEKTPLTAHGLKDAAADPDVVDRWWGRWPDANIGLATGHGAGFWVLDVDGEAGEEALTALLREHGSLPQTLEARTGGGGRHLVFAWSASREVRNRQSIRPGLDVRGEGGYIVAPPSVHPNGRTYAWVDEETPIAEAPAWLLDVVASAETEIAPQPAAPPKRAVPPWERLNPSGPAPAAVPAPAPVPAAVTQAPVVERARRYLAECEPAVQGRGGHNALLWAARAMVVGFELDDSTATDLLWSEYNPRCSPPWDRGKPGDVRDFERKVGEARRTPGEKRPGWLLDQSGLRASTALLEQIGRESAVRLLADPLKSGNPEAPGEDRNAGWREFPLEVLPAKIADFVRVAALSHSVDPTAVVLPLLATAGAALGNAWRLELKPEFLVPPTLWTIFVALSGANKSGPLDLVTAPMWKAPALPDGGACLLAGHQGQYVIDDATVEAVICRLAECPRGLLLAAPELGQWAQSFNAYRAKGRGGDEQVWIRLWDTKPYRVDRKTNNEQRVLSAPSVAIAGAIQPALLEKAADAENLASGLLARALVAMPPDRLRRWESEGVTREWSAFWADTVNTMRGSPFAAFDPNAGSHEPNVVGLSPEATGVWVEYFDVIAERVHAAWGVERSLAAKSDQMAARLGLVVYGLECALGNLSWGEPVPAQTMKAGVQAARWFLDESLRVFEAVCRTARDEGRERLVRLIAGNRHGGSITVRDLQRSSDRYSGPGGSERARGDLRDLAASGRGVFKDSQFTMAAS